jgi:enoyl-CoA hydratase/carnithine racemase
VTTRPESFIRSGRAGEALVLCIARPEVRNALHGPACAELGRLLDQAEADPAVRAVIVTGDGDKAFCAGFDLGWADQHPEVYADPLFGSELVRRPAHAKPLIAAVNGLALGLGFELALACDLIVAAPQARFGLPEPTVGLAAMGGGVVRLTRQLGLKRALGIALTGRMVSAEEGIRLGFVNEVAEGPVLEAAQRWAGDVARGAPLSVGATLEMAYRAEELPLEAALDPRRHPGVMRVLDSEDAAEGRKAFLERRQPVWRGC